MNGLLLAQLAEVVKHCDKECVEFFRCGADFIGHLPASGIGVPCDSSLDAGLCELESGLVDRNTALLASLKEDAQSCALLRAAREDASVGRMTEPALLRERERERSF